MLKAVTSAVRRGAEGIRVQWGGRLGGNECAGSGGDHDGRVPLHTLRADIDFAK
jgi:small subunit ribosomal protein S3